MQFQIDRYHFGEMEINHTLYQKDLIISADQIYAHWWRDEGHLVQKMDLKPYIGELPDIIIVGTGSSGRMKVAPDVMTWLTEELSIPVKILPTEEAVKEFNKGVSREKKVLGAFHLTC